MDDKGHLLMAVWGIPPTVHRDDSNRAVMASLDIISSIKALSQASKIEVPFLSC